VAITLGVALPHYDASLPAGGRIGGRELVAAAQAAERLGFRAGWVFDHFTLPLDRYGLPAAETSGLEPWMALSAVAARTSALRVGTFVLAEAFRRPGVLAKMVATLDRLSDGRLDVGLGAGWQEAEHRRHDIPFGSPGERLARLEECIRVLRESYAGSPFSYAGHHHQVEGAWAVPGVVQRPGPPIWVGGSGDRLLGVAARVADGWNFGWRVGDAFLDDRLAVLHRACESVGRDPATMRVSLGLYCALGAPADEDALVGSVEQVRDRLGRLEERGVEHVVVTPPPFPSTWTDDWAESVAGTLIQGPPCVAGDGHAASNVPRTGQTREDVL
jgi:probable F420-dependent oxidoreductase